MGLLKRNFYSEKKTAIYRCPHTHIAKKFMESSRMAKNHFLSVTVYNSSYFYSYILNVSILYNISYMYKLTMHTMSTVIM